MIAREDHNGVAVLQLSHGKANTLDLELLLALGTEIDNLDAQVKALVLTGRDRMFSPGIDLPNLLEHGTDYTLDLVDALNKILERFIDLPIPSVAAINGHAIAGGFILACGCDIRLMADGRGQVGLTEFLLGVPFPPLALELIRAAVGEGNAKRLALQAELLPAETAHSLGLVDGLTPPETLLESAIRTARRLGAIPRTTFELTKRQLMAPLRMRLAHLGTSHEQATGQVWVTGETRQIMQTFVKRRLG
jgi:enoyl-CoA hydratase